MQQVPLDHHNDDKKSTHTSNGNSDAQHDLHYQDLGSEVGSIKQTVGVSKMEAVARVTQGKAGRKYLIGIALAVYACNWVVSTVVSPKHTRLLLTKRHASRSTRWREARPTLTLSGLQATSASTLGVSQPSTSLPESSLPSARLVSIFTADPQWHRVDLVLVAQSSPASPTSLDVVKSMLLA